MQDVLQFFLNRMCSVQCADDDRNVGEVFGRQGLARRITEIALGVPVIQQIGRKESRIEYDYYTRERQYVYHGNLTQYLVWNAATDMSGLYKRVGRTIVMTS